MRRTRHSIAVVIAALLATYAAAQNTDPSTIVATARGMRVSADQIETYARLLRSPHPDLLAAFASKSEPERRDAEYFLKRALLEMPWSTRMADMAKAADFPLTAPEQAAIDDAYQQCLISEWQQSQVEKLTTLTREQVRDLWSRYGNQFGSPAMREVSYIYVSTTSTATAAKRQHVMNTLKAVRDQVLSGTMSFKQAAQLYSEAPSAGNGGLAGYVQKDSPYNKRFIDLVFSTPERTISSPTELHNGIYLVQVGKVVPATKPDENDALSSAALQTELLGIARAELARDTGKQLKEKYPGKQLAEAVALQAASIGTSFPECELTRQLMAMRALGLSYFAHIHEKDFEPTDTETADYYTSNPSEMKEEGIWRLTMFLVPVSGSPDAKVASREEARKIIAEVREKAAKGSTSETLLDAYSPDVLTIQKNPDWLKGSGDAAADGELLKMSPGEFTPVHVGNVGAYFFRLDDKRELPTKPLSAMREYIVGVLRATKMNTIIEADQVRHAKEVGLKAVGPLEGLKLY